MMYRPFGRVGTPVAEIGYGVWGIGGWTGSKTTHRCAAPPRSRSRLNFFDTALVYSEGHSETLGRKPRRNLPRPLRTWPRKSPRRTALARSARLPARRVVPDGLHQQVHGEEPLQARRPDISTCSNCTSGRTRGSATSSGGAPPRISGRRANRQSRVRNHHESPGALEPPSARSGPARSTPSRSSTTSSTRPGRGTLSACQEQTSG